MHALPIIRREWPSVAEDLDDGVSVDDVRDRAAELFDSEEYGRLCALLEVHEAGLEQLKQSGNRLTETRFAVIWNEEEIHPSPDGEFVLFDAYEALKERLEERRAAATQLRRERDDIRAELKALEEPIGVAAENYEEAISLIKDLLVDAERIYEPGYEDPPHIAAARHLEDHLGALAGLEVALAALDQERADDDAA